MGLKWETTPLYPTQWPLITIYASAVNKNFLFFGVFRPALTRQQYLGATIEATPTYRPPKMSGQSLLSAKTNYPAASYWVSDAQPKWVYSKLLGMNPQ
jgi:hypothetical protein